MSDCLYLTVLNMYAFHCVFVYVCQEKYNFINCKTYMFKRHNPV